MDKTPHNLLVTSSASADGIVPEQTLPSPHFDEKAVRQARPAVPLEQIKARVLWLVIVLMCSSALLGGIMGIALSRYENRSEQILPPAASVAPEGSDVSIPMSRDSDRIVKSTPNDPNRFRSPLPTPKRKLMTWNRAPRKEMPTRNAPPIRARTVQSTSP